MMSTAEVTLYDRVSSEMSSQAPPFDSSRTPVVERKCKRDDDCQHPPQHAHCCALLCCTVSTPAPVIRERSAEQSILSNKVYSRFGKGGGLSACMVM